MFTSYECDSCGKDTLVEEGTKGYDGSNFVLFLCNDCHKPNQEYHPKGAACDDNPLGLQGTPSKENMNDIPF